MAVPVVERSAFVGYSIEADQGRLKARLRSMRGLNGSARPE